MELDMTTLQTWTVLKAKMTETYLLKHIQFQTPALKGFIKAQ